MSTVRGDARGAPSWLPRSSGDVVQGGAHTGLLPLHLRVSRFRRFCATPVICSPRKFARSWSAIAQNPLFIGLCFGFDFVGTVQRSTLEVPFFASKLDFPARSRLTGHQAKRPASCRNCSTDLRPAKKRPPFAPGRPTTGDNERAALASRQRPDVFQFPLVQISPQLILAPLQRLAQFAPAKGDLLRGGFRLRRAWLCT